MYRNRISDFEEAIGHTLAQLAHHMHPAIVAKIQTRNQEERPYFESLFGERIPTSRYLFSGSACVFPGVKRYVSGQGIRSTFNSKLNAIIDDNVFPRHLWCFVAGNKAYSGFAWKHLELSSFELAHIFSHKKSELSTESEFFENFSSEMLPFGDFSCACNIVLLPKGAVRPTDNSRALKAVFYKRYIDLYGETPLQGRSGFRHELVPSWYERLQWYEPLLPADWESRIDELLAYRTKRITDIMNRNEI